MKLEEQIENHDIFSDSNDNSNKELNFNFDINQLSNIKGKNNDNASSLSSSSYPTDLSNYNSSQNEKNAFSSNKYT